MFLCKPAVLELTSWHRASTRAPTVTPAVLRAKQDGASCPSFCPGHLCSQRASPGPAGLQAAWVLVPSSRADSDVCAVEVALQHLILSPRILQPVGHRPPAGLLGTSRAGGRQTAHAGAGIPKFMSVSCLALVKWVFCFSREGSRLADRRELQPPALAVLPCGRGAGVALSVPRVHLSVSGHASTLRRAGAAGRRVARAALSVLWSAATAPGGCSSSVHAGRLRQGAPGLPVRVRASLLL